MYISHLMFNLIFTLCNFTTISLHVEWGKLTTGLLRNTVNNFTYHWMPWSEGTDTCTLCSHSEAGQAPLRLYVSSQKPHLLKSEKISITMLKIYMHSNGNFFKLIQYMYRYIIFQINKILVKWRLYTRRSPVQTRVFHSKNMNGSFITGGTQKWGIMAEGNATKQNLVLCNCQLIHLPSSNEQFTDNQRLLTPVECTEHDEYY